MHFAFRPKGSVEECRFYRSPRWWDARAAAATHYPATDELEWVTIEEATFNAVLERAHPSWIYDVTWTGHDSGRIPTRKMHVTELRRGIPMTEAGLLDPNEMHCRRDDTSCRGESYCSCQCKLCFEANEIAEAWYAARPEREGT